jgi:hypothetical protein
MKYKIGDLLAINHDKYKDREWEIVGYGTATDKYCLYSPPGTAKYILAKELDELMENGKMTGHHKEEDFELPIAEKIVKVKTTKEAVVEIDLAEKTEELNKEKVEELLKSKACKKPSELKRGKK